MSKKKYSDDELDDITRPLEPVKSALIPDFLLPVPAAPASPCNSCGSTDSVSVISSSQGEVLGCKGCGHVWMKIV